MPTYLRNTVTAVLTVAFTTILFAPIVACGTEKHTKECAEKCEREAQECGKKHEKDCEARAKHCGEECAR